MSWTSVGKKRLCCCLKANADARVAEARAKSMEENGADVEKALDRIMDKLVNESDKKG